MRLLSIAEATTSWLGNIQVKLGTGAAETLNFGSGDPKRPGFLYIPIQLDRVRTMIRYMTRGKTAYYVEGKGGLVIPSEQKDRIPPGALVIPDPGKRLTRVGEAHITVSMGPELEKALVGDPQGTLTKAGLFNTFGQGVRCPIEYTGLLRVLQAGFYKDEYDPKGPILIAEEVHVSNMIHIRESLGLPAMPVLPNGQPYIPHITYGYIAERNLIHQTYIQKHGSTPRARRNATTLSNDDGSAIS